MDSVYSFAYEIKGEGAVIRRCFSHDSCVVIPQELGGLPVIGLGAYAFSAHLDEKGLERELSDGSVRLYVPELLCAALPEPYSPGDAVPREAACGMECDSDRADDEAGDDLDAGARETGAAVRWQQLKDLLPPALCGTRLEEAVLPATLRRVDRYCFYNCGSLRSLEFGARLDDWGSGVFTGCHQVARLTVHTGRDTRSSLKQVLDELWEEMEVTLELEDAPPAVEVASEIPEKPPGEAGSEEKTAGTTVPYARLIFPEFYEEGVENTPARILETHVHGSGMKYRNCFRNHCFDFVQYDALFLHACAQESPELVAALVLGRLCYPAELSEKARAQYESYAAGHAAELAGYALSRRDMNGLRKLTEQLRTRDTNQVEKNFDFQNFLAAAVKQAAELNYTEALSYLMDSGHTRQSGRRTRERRWEL